VANPRAQGQVLLRLMEAPMTLSPAALAKGVGSPVSIDSSTQELPVLQQGALPGQFALYRLHPGRTGVVVAAGGGVGFDRHPGLAPHDRTLFSLWRLAWPISPQKLLCALISGAWQGDGGWQCKGHPQRPDPLFIVPDHDVPVVVISLEP
jgi:hypothetical protein